MLGSVGGDLKSLDLTSSTFLGWVPPSLEQVSAVDVVVVVVVSVVVALSTFLGWPSLERVPASATLLTESWLILLTISS